MKFAARLHSHSCPLPDSQKLLPVIVSVLCKFKWRRQAWSLHQVDTGDKARGTENLPASIRVQARLKVSWGVHPIAHGRDFGFIHPVMKSRRVTQIEMGRRRRFKT
jgi:hypothetical protein